MASSTNSRSHELSHSYFDVIDDQSSQSSSWHELVREHSKTQPVVPNSDFLTKRSQSIASTASISLMSRNEFDLSRQVVLPDDDSSHSRANTTSGRWSKGPLVRDRSKYDGSSNYSSNKLSHVSRSSGTTKKESFFEPSSSAASCDFSHGSKRCTDPLLWTIGSSARDAMITVHRPISCSPGPKYLLGPLVLRTHKFISTTSGSRSLSPHRTNGSTFSKQRRMPDEAPRSPGPAFYPADPKGVLSQNGKGSPKLHAYGRELLGSIYYDGFNSSGASVIYNTMDHFDAESKRMSTPSVVVGRPTTVDATKYPPIRPNSRY